jgi:hypothetical protein
MNAVAEMNKETTFNKAATRNAPLLSHQSLHLDNDSQTLDVATATQVHQYRHATHDIHALSVHRAAHQVAMPTQTL